MQIITVWNNVPTQIIDIYIMMEWKGLVFDPKLYGVCECARFLQVSVVLTIP